MDFSNENFNEKDWINNILQSNDTDNLDTSITSILTKLQLLSDDIGLNIEKCVDKSISAIPQIVFIYLFRIKNYLLFN